MKGTGGREAIWLCAKFPLSSETTDWGLCHQMCATRCVLCSTVVEKKASEGRSNRETLLCMELLQWKRAVGEHCPAAEVPALLVC